MAIYSLLRRNSYCDPFKGIGPLLLKPLIYQVVSEHISDYNCEIPTGQDSVLLTRPWGPALPTEEILRDCSVLTYCAQL